MGQGASSGQIVTIENRTPFTLRIDGGPSIVCGKEINTPTEIPSILLDQSESSLNLRNTPNMHLENSGKSSASYGSEIQYSYRFEGTPNDNWFLKIWSIGAYYTENACFSAQILKNDKVMAQTSWRNTAIHGEHNPDNSKDRTTNPDCFFQLSISAVTPLPEKGSGFYEIPLKVTMKPIVVENVRSGKEVEISRDIINTEYQTLLPEGSDTVINQYTRETQMMITNTVDKKWGCEYSYTHEVQLDFGLGMESQAKAGDSKVEGGEATVTTKGNFHFGYGFTSQTKEVTESTNRHQTETVTISKQSYTWKFEKKVEKQETVKIETTKVTYRQEFTDIKTNTVVAIKERYVYHHEASIEPPN